MTNTRAAHFGRAIQLMIKYGSELEQLHHQYNDALLTELRGAGIDEDALEKITTGDFSHKDGDKPIVQVIIDIARNALFAIREEGGAE